jgi:phenylpropionate dioxygenase-like ring-hydroxylating dioxygenase large terminal subunit
MAARSGELDGTRGDQMNRETELALIDRALAHLAARTTDLEGEPYRVSTASYTDPSIFERELELFQRGSFFAAHALFLREPGDYLTFEIGTRPMVLMRSDDGVRAFLNVCRHRGTRLLPERQGHVGPRFSCPYHAWTYDRCGALVGMPHAYGFEGATSGRHLVSMQARMENGFVVLGNDACPLLSEIEALVGPTPALYVPERRVLRCNWKLAMDIFLEAYHVMVAHRGTIAPRFADNVSAIDRFGSHQRLLFVKRTLAELANVAREDRKLRPHANVLYQLFPNTFALVQPDHVSVIHVFPISITECELFTYTLLPEEPASDKARAYWAKNDRILKDAVAEDYAMAESIQRGLLSSANDDFLFGRFEQGLTHFHRCIEVKTQHGG